MMAIIRVKTMSVSNYLRVKTMSVSKKLKKEDIVSFSLWVLVGSMSSNPIFNMCFLAGSLSLRHVCPLNDPLKHKEGL